MVVTDIVLDETAQVSLVEDEYVIQKISATASGPMPSDNRFWFDDDQGMAPYRPKPAEQSPKYSILDSDPSASMFSLEYAQLLT
jgi:hypothetical protein